MFSLLLLIPLLPCTGFLCLVLAGTRLNRRAAASIGAGSVGLSALLAIWIGIQFVAAPPPQQFYVQTLWTWFNVAGFQPGISLYLDGLSLVMVLVITVVGFLIHVYSSEFMQPEEGYNRFFAYMNLFVGSMLILVLADNLLLLYLGWEGVGLCSYLLIGFWYKNPENGRAARKAFVVTRVGDTALAIGLFVLFSHLGTLQIQELMQRAAQQWPTGSSLAVTAAALLLGGAVGKSAQLPLQTWLPDAMAGPTPVSALIHAATMVTAGVYLIARTHVLFSLAPLVMTAVAVIGAATLLLAGFSALVQHDLKRILAYSTMSQVGYMFLALGVGAWSAAIFHLMVHAFFKSLLFLSAGVVILGLHEEHDVFKMGGLRKQLPVVFWTFLIGAASLSALPLITAGFYSKDLILWQAFASPLGNPWLWAAGLAGAFLTSLYTFRMVFLVFFGKSDQQVKLKPGLPISVPLGLLAVFSIFIGFLNVPGILGGRALFTQFLDASLQSLSPLQNLADKEGIFEGIAGLASLAGIGMAYLFYLRFRQLTSRLANFKPAEALAHFWYAGWGFDTLYRGVFIHPYLILAQAFRDDPVDRAYQGVAWLARESNYGLSRIQSGKVRWYALAIAAGAVVIIALLVLL